MRYEREQVQLEAAVKYVPKQPLEVHQGGQWHRTTFSELMKGSKALVELSGGPMATRTTVLSARQLEAHRRATAGPARSHSPASKLREQVRRSAWRPRAPRPLLLSHVPRFPAQRRVVGLPPPAQVQRRHFR